MDTKRRFRRFHVLLIGQSELRVKETIVENIERFEDQFDTIIPWEDHFEAVDKLVWIRYMRLPQNKRSTLGEAEHVGTMGKTNSLFRLHLPSSLAKEL